jgi:hypothetical protein
MYLLPSFAGYVEYLNSSCVLGRKPVCAILLYDVQLKYVVVYVTCVVSLGYTQQRHTDGHAARNQHYETANTFFCLLNATF